MFNLLNKTDRNQFTKDDIAAMLRMDPEAFATFEKEYARQGISVDDMVKMDAKNAASQKEGIDLSGPENLDGMISRVVAELLADTQRWTYDGNVVTAWHTVIDPDTYATVKPLTKDEVMSIPPEYRPMLTGTLSCRDTGGEPSCYAVLEMYKGYMQETNPRKRNTLYGMFRQGLDILDLDPVLYEMLGMNRNSMGYWLPRIIRPVLDHGFFRIPKTTVIKVPLPLLQLSRIEYGLLNRVTLDIVDKFCCEAFQLEQDKEYFIKTGTFSSKYDFRNAHVKGAKEVRELGEYLVFIQNQACMMSGPLAQPSIYGVSTTNEFVVREFIPAGDVPCIYHGLPLRPEYRLFVDFDHKDVIGRSPYWEPGMMKKRFGKGPDADDPDNVHDYITFSMQEKDLSKAYDENIGKVEKAVTEFIQDVNLQGQWSLDIMQNGEDFYIIDMALAQNSALYSCVPDHLKVPLEEEWFPKL